MVIRDTRGARRRNHGVFGRRWANRRIRRLEGGAGGTAGTTTSRTGSIGQGGVTSRTALTSLGAAAWSSTTSASTSVDAGDGGNGHDAGPGDAGDAGPEDAGVHHDGGDSGAEDAGDAGSEDAGDAASEDAGSPLLAQGAACGAGAECASTFCVDGFCCSVECNTACVACSAVSTGTGANGTWRCRRERALFPGPMRGHGGVNLRLRRQLQRGRVRVLVLGHGLPGSRLLVRRGDHGRNLRWERHVQQRDDERVRAGHLQRCGDRVHVELRHRERL